MKTGIILSLVLAGALGGAFLRGRITPTVVHAQDEFNNLQYCVTAVPKAWGTYRGASTYGIAFEDQGGTLRFVQRPACSAGTTGSSAAVPVSAADLQIERR